MSNNFTFIIIDDDKLVLNNLNLIIGKFFPDVNIKFANNGKEGFALIEKYHNNCIVILDIYMPIMNGFDLLEHLRNDEIYKDIYIIMMSGSDEKDAGVKSLQKGADDILHKPLHVDSLIARLRVASRLVNSKLQLKEKEEKFNEVITELKNEKYKFIDTINQIIATRLPEKINNIENVEKIAKWISDRISNFNKQELTDLLDASKLLYIGNLALTDNLINASVMKDGFIASPTMQKVPDFSFNSIKQIKDLENAAKILFHVFENNDGTGYPHKLKLWQIPKASKILRVIRDFYQLHLDNKLPQHKALETMFMEINRLYDWEILVYLDQYFANFDQSPTKPEKKVILKELEEGMIISRNVYSVAGHLLVSRGITLTGEIIMKIKQINHQDGILGNVYIFEDSKKKKPLLADNIVKIDDNNNITTK